MSEGKVSVPVATSVGLGAIIGAGIFTLSGSAIALAGSSALLAFALVGAVAILLALELGELGSLLPEAQGASYSYAYHAFGSEMGFLVGILLFVSYSTATAAIALGFGAYLGHLLGIGSGLARGFAAGLIVLLAGVNLVGVKKAARVDFGLVLVKLVILLVFIGFAFLAGLSAGASSVLPHLTTGPGQGGVGSIFAASVAIFFAYSGFQAISTLTSDVEGGARGAAIAILASVLISIVLYVLVALAMLVLVPATAFRINADPLAFALSYAHAPSTLGILIDVGALVATASATLAMILSASRIARQIAVDGLLPRQLRRYDADRDVAVNGVVLAGAVGVVALLFGNVYIIAAVSNFGLLVSYLIVSFAVVHFRRLGREADFRTPLYPYVPAAAAVGTLAFLLGMPREALMVGVILVLGLLATYYLLAEAEEREVPRIRLFD